VVFLQPDALHPLLMWKFAKSDIDCTENRLLTKHHMSERFALNKYMNMFLRTRSVQYFFTLWACC